MLRVMARTFNGRLSLLMASSKSVAMMPPWMWPGGPSCIRSSWKWEVAVMASGLVVSVVKTRCRPWGLAGPQPKQWLARSSMVGVDANEAGAWRLVSGLVFSVLVSVMVVAGGSVLGP